MPPQPKTPSPLPQTSVMDSQPEDSNSKEQGTSDPEEIKEADGSEKAKAKKAKKSKKKKKSKTEENSTKEENEDEAKNPEEAEKNNENKENTKPSSPSQPNNESEEKQLPPVKRPSKGSVSRSSENSSPAVSLAGRGSIWSMSSGARSQNRGEINYVFAEPLEKKYECPICCQVLRYPVQFEDCGHRCCSSCLPELLRVAPRCPVDQSKVDRDKILVDKAFQKELDNLAVKCSYAERGCEWAQKLGSLISHVDVCEYAVVPCPKGCDAEFERRFLTKHQRQDCPKRGIFCEFCNTEISSEEEEQHLRVCELFPMHCPNGCKKKEIPRNKIKDHMANDCPKQKATCPFGEGGCDFQGVRKEIDQHLKDEASKHLKMISSSINEYKATLEAHAKVIDNHTDRLLDVEAKVESLEKLYGSQLVWKIDNYSEKLQDSKSGKKSTIYSPPFLTNRHGYKLALSACLYGDGKARGKYMSLFVCICKGEYDALLIWPFSHRITFTLVDQCQDPAARRNVTYTIKPNTCKENRPFLGRPTGERNASFGAQKFVELPVLNTLDYIRDDTIFIKVNIDSENMQIV